MTPPTASRRANTLTQLKHAVRRDAGTSAQRLNSIPAPGIEVSGLQVADASVRLSAPSANTNTTVYAIAERAAALIQAR